MAAQSGKSILVRFKDDAGSPAFQTVAGLRSRSIQLNQETVDITNADSANNYRELLAGVGVRSLTISGDGVFTDSVGENEIKDAFMENEFRDAEFTVPGLGVFTCSVQVTSLQYSGDYNKEVTCSVTFESAGAITFT